MAADIAGQNPLQRALSTARSLKPGTWESVEARALLALETRGTPEAVDLLDAAGSAAAKLRSSTWDSIRALAWLARAEREVRPR